MGMDIVILEASSEAPLVGKSNVQETMEKKVNSIETEKIVDVVGNKEAIDFLAANFGAFFFR